MNDKLAPPDAQAAAANVHSTEGQNIGHGHVFPRPDGVRARCGGPALCPACARDLARKNIEAGSSGGASGNHIADAGKMVASGAGTKPWCPNCEDRDPHCMACAGEGHKRKSSGEPSGSAEIRFVMGGNVYGRPTATDALDYADDRLQDPEEMQCCLTDARVKHMNAVRELLAGVTPEPREQQWQPIETAPKGRTLLLGYWNDLGNWRTVMGCYYAEETLESETEDSGFAPPGWYESTQAYEYLAPLDKEPTHWQPLPKGLPKRSQETKGETACLIISYTAIDTAQWFRRRTLGRWRIAWMFAWRFWPA